MGRFFKPLWRSLSSATEHAEDLTHNIDVILHDQDVRQRHHSCEQIHTSYVHGRAGIICSFKNTASTVTLSLTPHIGISVMAALTISSQGSSPFCLELMANSHTNLGFKTSHNPDYKEKKNPSQRKKKRIHREEVAHHSLWYSIV